MATMLLMVAGVKYWSAEQDRVEKLSSGGKFELNEGTNTPDSNTPLDEQAKISALVLDAVITPAISFGFSQYFYLLTPQVWSFVEKESVPEMAFKAPLYLLTCFSRIFGCYIVTNAP